MYSSGSASPFSIISGLRENTRDVFWNLFERELRQTGHNLSPS